MPYHMGLIGHNISYSLSPAIFARLFELSGKEGTFSLIDVDPSQLPSKLDLLKRLNGFSVTIPHKLGIQRYLDDITDAAQSIGAVNSVKVDRGNLIGHNTDWEGFLLPLQNQYKDLRTVLVLGTGGAARAVIWGLQRQNPKARFIICGRDQGRVSFFASELGKLSNSAPDITPLDYERIPDDGDFDLIVNCTPVGQGAYESVSPLPEAFEFSGRPLCYDLIYSPAKTRFLAEANRHDCQTINGIQMLIMQAVLSYTVWSGIRMDCLAVAKDIETAWKEIKEYTQ